ncbi:MAG: ATP-binding protein [Planctomycetota bacterium]|jgi:hypothetical protein|nr:ATP-binding protein [Planctomycetota bacterium]
MTVPPFLSDIGRLFNSGEARVAVLTGNIHDLFPAPGGAWQPLPEVLAGHWQVPGRIVLTYEINGPIRFHRPQDRQLVKDAWLRWRHGRDSGDLTLASLAASGAARDELLAHSRSFDEQILAAVGRPTVALELLRQCCLCSRARDSKGAAFLEPDLALIIEGADLILPEAPVTGLADADRQRLHIALDWFADPGFAAGADVVALLTEAAAGLNARLLRLPEVVKISVDEPDRDVRRAFLAAQSGERWCPTDSELDTLADGTAGLGLQALRQLAMAAEHAGQAPDEAAVVARVERHIQAQLGEDVVSFKRPGHGLRQVVGARALTGFLRDELAPRIRAGGAGALSGCAVAGPIGAGKTFIFEALAGELGLPVLELGSIRSQWFGQTDVIIERLRRVLTSLGRVVIIVDEADTQFGRLSDQSHETERRLTGKIQAMMSDPALLGKVFWLLMTARIERLSPDLRRPGRVGDLIVPVLDPEPDDRADFVAWALKPSLGSEIDPAVLERITAATSGYSAAAYAALRRELAALGRVDADRVQALVDDLLPADIGAARRYQTLQALVNCTRRSLLPDPTVSEATREAWHNELRSLEARGLA